MQFGVRAAGAAGYPRPSFKSPQVNGIAAWRLTS
jgi:hypothetical protein